MLRIAAEIGEWIAEQHGVNYRIRGLYSLLRRLRCGPKILRPVHAKADQHEPDRWKSEASVRL